MVGTTWERDSAEAAGVDGILAGYERGSSFLLATPQRTLLTSGEVRDLAPAQAGCSADLGVRAAATLRHARSAGQVDPVLVGAVPFTDDTPARLFVPEHADFSAPLVGTASAAAPTSAVSAVDVESVPDRSGYAAGVRRALGEFDDRDIAKVVLARTLRLRLAEPIDVGNLLGNLARNDPSAYVFALDVPARDGAPAVAGTTTLAGASPELLVRRSGNTVTANPLAGSLPRSRDPAVDRGRARALRDSAKDANEHELVVRAVSRALRQFCTTVDVPETPSLSGTATMWHLSTQVTGELADPATSSLTLAEALHPTPAVCGVPTTPARDLITGIEPFDRGFYSGMVGWCDESGDGEWAIMLRCAEVGERRLRLFAGAGIVPGSDPDGEFEETAAKFSTMLRAIGVDGVEHR